MPVIISAISLKGKQINIHSNSVRVVPAAWTVSSGVCSRCYKPSKCISRALRSVITIERAVDGRHQKLFSNRLLFQRDVKNTSSFVA
eukprot:scaffold84719_cov15-Prasinocladus_malaysianus.AAC.2